MSAQPRLVRFHDVRPRERTFGPNRDRRQNQAAESRSAHSLHYCFPTVCGDSVADARQLRSGLARTEYSHLICAEPPLKPRAAERADLSPPTALSGFVPQPFPDNSIDLGAAVCEAPILVG